MKMHTYRTQLQWTGNTGSGTRDYRSYLRDHTLQAGNKPVIAGSSDPAFRGNPERYNPEELLLASLSACHMLWYLHLCAVNGVVVTDYRDAAAGQMLENEDGSGRFTEAVLYPVVTVQKADMVAQAHALHAEAHQKCFIANSCNFPVHHRDVTLCLAEPDDAALLAQLGRTTFEEAFAAQNDPDNLAEYMQTAFQTTQITQEFDEPDAHFCLAYADHVPVSYAKWRANDEPAALQGFKNLELQRIYVLAQYQGLKIGKALLDTALAHARQQHYDYMWLGVWEHNAKAIQFYQRAGFVHFDAHDFMMGTEKQTDWLFKLRVLD
jgi:organic hydroperoxide reductase OsmC/OhrA/ribosomal protein S18 acetylase RimI-like enzyme